MGVPGVRGVDHIGLTVPDMDEAVRFFSDVLGCERIMAFGPVGDPKGDFMAQALGVHPRAVINEIVMLRSGWGSNLELFSYSAPDQTTVAAKNSDVGAHHIAFYVDDIDAAAAYLRGKGVQCRLGPIPMTEGPSAGQSILYFNAPWGLQLEAISYPAGMAYEKAAPRPLWSPKAPTL